VFREACSWQIERCREGWIFSKGEMRGCGIGMGMGVTKGGVAGSQGSG